MIITGAAAVGSRAGRASSRADPRPRPRAQLGDGAALGGGEVARPDARDQDAVPAAGRLEEVRPARQARVDLAADAPPDLVGPEPLDQRVDAAFVHPRREDLAQERAPGVVRIGVAVDRRGPGARSSAMRATRPRPAVVPRARPPSDARSRRGRRARGRSRAPRRRPPGGRRPRCGCARRRARRVGASARPTSMISSVGRRRRAGRRGPCSCPRRLRRVRRRRRRAHLGDLRWRRRRGRPCPSRRPAAPRTRRAAGS